MHFPTSLSIVAEFVLVDLRRAVSTVIAPMALSTPVDDRQPPQSIATLFVALGHRARTDIRAVSDRLEHLFAEFSGVPYQSPLTRQQWEDLWETET